VPRIAGGVVGVALEFVAGDQTCRCLNTGQFSNLAVRESDTVELKVIERPLERKHTSLTRADLKLDFKRPNRIPSALTTSIELSIHKKPRRSIFG
jgi:hypothetical protein